jgi:type IV secretion system protein VirB10
MRIFRKKNRNPAGFDGEIVDERFDGHSNEKNHTGTIEDEGAEAEVEGDGNVADDSQARALRGERGIASVNRARSVESRVSSVLAMGLMTVLGLSMLTWYYANAMTRQTRARQSAQALSTNRAQGEMPLPSLGKIDEPPPWRAGPPPSLPVVKDEMSQPPIEPVLEPVPLASPVGKSSPWNTLPGSLPPGYAPAPAGYGVPPVKTPAQLAFERRLSGAAFAHSSEGAAAVNGRPEAMIYGKDEIKDNVNVEGEGMTGSDVSDQRTAAGMRDVSNDAFASKDSAAAVAARQSARNEDGMSTLLRPNVTPAVRAQVLPTQRLLLAKGAFIDCTLETAIDSTLPGMTTCITATDTFSVDGKVVLLERGTKLVGETRGQVQQGAARVFVLWTEARTPAGIIVPLASPGADELGRSGLPGQVNRHFWERFGAAILISMIDGAMQSAVQSSSKAGGTVVYNPSASQDIMTEVLKGTVNIPPTIVKHNGDRIQVLVARDLDFRSVYELRSVATSR